MNNFKQIGMGISRFAEDNRGHFVGSGYKLKYTGADAWAGNGAVTWRSIINATVFRDDVQVAAVAKSTGLPDGALGCPSMPLYDSSISGVGSVRTLALCNTVVNGGPQVADQTKWPTDIVPFSPSSTDAFYQLGCRESRFTHPSTSLMLVDWEMGSNADTFGAQTYNQMKYNISPYSGIPYYGVNGSYIGGLSMRHGAGGSGNASALYVDQHATVLPTLPDDWDTARTR